MSSDSMRTERDSMGEMQVPTDARYGASTRRAMLNFPISDLRFGRRMIRALGRIKGAAARVNAELDLLAPRLAEAIAQAADEVAEGVHDNQFVVDLFQTGSGTSTHINANEVIAHRATEILGGGARVHPNDHVNLGQSSNDVIPSAAHLAALLGIRETLEPGLAALREALEVKSEELWETIKTGRTHLQDATPIRLGQVFRGYAGQIERAERRVRHAAEGLAEVALGGTAVGTGLNTHPEFAGRVCDAVFRTTGIELRETSNHFQAQSAIDEMLDASGAMRRVAVAVLKIANDLRLLASGPRTGIGELVLPEVQPGSSIMPGKINPVIAESTIQVCVQVLANDQAVLQAGEWGFFELNAMLPVASHNLQQSIELLGAATANFAANCVRGLTATERGPLAVEGGLAIVTGLVPRIGYDLAASIAKEAADGGRTIREVAETRTDLSAEELDVALDPFRMT